MTGQFDSSVAADVMPGKTSSHEHGGNEGNDIMTCSDVTVYCTDISSTCLSVFGRTLFRGLAILNVMDW